MKEERSIDAQHIDYLAKAFFDEYGVPPYMSSFTVNDIRTISSKLGFERYKEIVDYYFKDPHDIFNQKSAKHFIEVAYMQIARKLSKHGKYDPEFEELVETVRLSKLTDEEKHAELIERCRRGEDW